MLMAERGCVFPWEQWEMVLSKNLASMLLKPMLQRQRHTTIHL